MASLNAVPSKAADTGMASSDTPPPTATNTRLPLGRTPYGLFSRRHAPLATGWTEDTRPVETYHALLTTDATGEYQDPGTRSRGGHDAAPIAASRCGRREPEASPSARHRTPHAKRMDAEVEGRQHRT